MRLWDPAAGGGASRIVNCAPGLGARAASPGKCVHEKLQYLLTGALEGKSSVSWRLRADFINKAQSRVSEEAGLLSVLLVGEKKLPGVFCLRERPPRPGGGGGRGSSS